MAEVKGNDGSLIELVDAVVMDLQTLREAQSNFAGTIRGAAVTAGAANIITSWNETNAGGGTLNVSLSIPVAVTASADGYNVSADAAFDDGL